MEKRFFPLEASNNKEKGFYYLDISDYLIEALEDINLGEIVYKISNDPENFEIFLNYFFYLNLYLSKYFVTIAGNFLDKNGIIDISYDAPLDYFKNFVFEKIDSTDLFALNMEKFENFDKEQMELLNEIINSLRRFENFGNSVFDKPRNHDETILDELMLVMGFQKNLLSSSNEYNKFEDFIYYKLIIYYTEFLEIIYGETDISKYSY